MICKISITDTNYDSFFVVWKYLFSELNFKLWKLEKIFLGVRPGEYGRWSINSNWNSWNFVMATVEVWIVCSLNETALSFSKYIVIFFVISVFSLSINDAIVCLYYCFTFFKIVNEHNSMIISKNTITISFSIFTFFGAGSLFVVHCFWLLLRIRNDWYPRIVNNYE